MHSNSVKKIRVWDLPTRLFHGALALGVFGLLVSGILGGNAMVWHLRLGYMVLALLLFRLVWGLIGGRWSRFAAFIYAPQRVRDYLQGRSPPAHTAGHSPLGALSVLAMLSVLLAQVGTGLLSDDEIAFAGPLTRFVSAATVSWSTQWHTQWGKWLVWVLIGLHLAAIAFYSHRKKGLLGAMWHGDKTLSPELPAARDDALTRAIAAVVLGACLALAYWVSTLAALN